MKITLKLFEQPFFVFVHNFGTSVCVCLCTVSFSTLPPISSNIEMMITSDNVFYTKLLLMQMGNQYFLCFTNSTFTFRKKHSCSICLMIWQWSSPMWLLLWDYILDFAYDISFNWGVTIEIQICWQLVGGSLNAKKYN